MFALFGLTLLVFRDNNLTHLGEMYHALVHGSWFAKPLGITALAYMLPLLVIDWVGRRHEFPMQHIPVPTWARWCLYWTLLGLIVFMV